MQALEQASDEGEGRHWGSLSSEPIRSGGAMLTESWNGVRTALSGVHGLQASSARSLDKHTHEAFSFTLVTQGAQRSHMRGRWMEAAAGDVLACEPHELHDERPGGGRLRSWKTLFVAPTLVAQALAAGTLGPDQQALCPAVLVKGLQESFTEVFETVRSGSAEDIFRGLARLLPSLVRVEEQRACGRQNETERARERMDLAPAAPHTVVELAEACGISRWHFIRVFAKETGQPPHAYLMRKRIELARTLMLQGVSLATAAANSGFADQSHMTRVFKRMYGESPGAWLSSAGPPGAGCSSSKPSNSQEPMPSAWARLAAG